MGGCSPSKDNPVNLSEPSIVPLVELDGMNALNTALEKNQITQEECAAVKTRLRSASLQLEPNEKACEIQALINHAVQTTVKDGGHPLPTCQVAAGIGVMMTDPAFVNLIVRNLLLDVLQCTQDAQIVCISARKVSVANKEHLWISVADSTERAPEQQWPQLFKPAIELDDGRCFSTLELCSALHGTCGFDNNPMHNSIFWIRIPYRAPSESDAHWAPGDQPVVPAVAPNDNGQILIIDDTLYILQLITLDLECLNIPVETAQSAAQGLALLKESPFALVLCDLRMPGLSGIEMTSQFRQWEREHRPDMHQVLYGLTAQVDDNVRQQCLEAGMDGVLEKPLDADNVKEMYDQALVRRQPHSCEGSPQCPT